MSQERLIRPTRVLVIGGTGYVGTDIVNSLLRSNGSVTVGSRRPDLHKEKVYLKPVSIVPMDVLSPDSWAVPNERYEAIVYCVGNFPPLGFSNELNRDVALESWQKFEEENSLHFKGLVNVVSSVFKKEHPYLCSGGHIVVISSAMTMYNSQKVFKLPAEVTIAPQVIAKTSQHNYVLWLRRSKSVMSRNICVHLIKPVAVYSSYYQGTDRDLMPERQISSGDIADKVMHCLRCWTPQTVWVPSQMSHLAILG